MHHSSNIVILDGFTLNPGDLNWDGFNEFDNVQIFDRTSPAQIVERAKDADILLVNKIEITNELLNQLPNLKCICVLATGFNNIDIQAAREKNIPVCNVKGYSSESVAQHVFAMILALTNSVIAHSNSVNAGDWSNCPDFSYTLHPIGELQAKTMGIYGFGRIGQAVAKIALAFGMNVIAKHKHPERDRMEGVAFVETEALFRESDIISLHAPLTPENAGMINRELLSTMKQSALLINTARGGFINEEDLKYALENKIIAGAGLDVLMAEPPAENHPLVNIPNCLITPHVAWASTEARTRLLNDTLQNVKSFLNGTPQNVVN